MDRSEAYKLLTEEMSKLTGLPRDRLARLCENTVESDHHGSKGTLYRVEMEVEQIADRRFVVIGRIHDNDAYHFSLLEERLEFNVGTSG